MKEKKCYNGTDELIKVGHIVEVKEGIANGNPPGTITKVTKVTNRERVHVLCEAVTEKSPFTSKDERNPKERFPRIPSWFELISDLEPATAEKRKKYYANKLAGTTTG